MHLYMEETHSKGDYMKKLIGYRKGYRIQIIDGFYEVIDGRRILYFGKCRKNSTIQEVINKTVDLNQEGTENVTYRRKRAAQVIGSRIS